MKRAPHHVQPFVQPAVGGVDVPGDFDLYHPLWRLVCSCGGQEFDIFKSALPRVLATCRRCGRNVSVYDIREYPAATVVPADDTLRAVADRVEVFVMYEYSELDEGEEFNPDDITWCQVFAKSPGTQARMVVDHETA